MGAAKTVSHYKTSPLGKRSCPPYLGSHAHTAEYDLLMRDRFIAEKDAAGWSVIDRKTGRVLANSLAEPFAGLARTDAVEIATLLSIGAQDTTVRFTFVDNLICIAANQGDPM